MKDFAAIDFEAANSKRTNIYSESIVIERNDEVVDKIYRTIKLFPDYYGYYNSVFHGMSS